MLRTRVPDVTEPAGSRVRVAGKRREVLVLIPAHNEEGSIRQTLESLAGQPASPDRVVVVADNCTDDTVEFARRAGADVFETAGNTYKKAGALNQALARYLPV